MLCATSQSKCAFTIFSVHAAAFEKVRKAGRCTWSTELQGEQALIREGGILCPVCMVIQGLRGDRLQLHLHLADLYVLDTDQFRKAREVIGDDAFNEVV